MSPMALAIVFGPNLFRFVLINATCTLINCSLRNYHLLCEVLHKDVTALFIVWIVALWLAVVDSQILLEASL